MPFPAPLDTYPNKDDVADFLRDYAAEFELPVRLNSKVTALSRTDEGYVGRDCKRQDRGQAGRCGDRSVPGAIYPGNRRRSSTRRIAQLHSAEYRDPESLPEGSVLVVGGANTGCQIALELSETRDVDIAVGDRLPALPQRPLRARYLVVANEAPGHPGHSSTRASAHGCRSATS